MAVHEFKLENLKELDDGRVIEAFNQAIKRAMDDVNDRPGMKKPRTVTLHTSIVPICDEHGMLDSVKVQMKIVDTVPKRETRVYDMAARRGGMLVFNDLSMDNAKQKTLDEDGGL